MYDGLMAMMMDHCWPLSSQRGDGLLCDIMTHCVQGPLDESNLTHVINMFGLFSMDVFFKSHKCLVNRAIGVDKWQLSATQFSNQLRVKSYSVGHFSN